MDDEQHTGADPLSLIEAENAMRNLAHMVSVFYDALVEEGFTPPNAFDLADTYLANTVVSAGND